MDIKWIESPDEYIVIEIDGVQHTLTMDAVDGGKNVRQWFQSIKADARKRERWRRTKEQLRVQIEEMQLEDEQ